MGNISYTVLNRKIPTEDATTQECRCNKSRQIIGL